MKISVIAAIGRNRELGKAGAEKLLWNIPEDFEHFKKTTMGKPVIMGLNTYNSIGRPLPGRLNIVLSKDPVEIQGVTVVDSLEKAYEVARATGADEVFNMGGASVYAQGIKDADRLYLTLIDADFPEADVFFPAYEHLFTKKIGVPKVSQNEQFCYQFVTLEK
jgi:dihydrofolate reductase